MTPQPDGERNNDLVLEEAEESLMRWFDHVGDYLDAYDTFTAIIEETP